MVNLDRPQAGLSRPGWHRFALLALTAWVLPWAAHAASPGEDCRDQAAIAERDAGIPAGLLLAIGKRESGAPDRATGGILPWPWAINQDGAGRYPDSRASAVAAIQEARAHGARSIDVGCFQISLLYHPHAFDTLDAAFDPALNAAYAAHFLATLRTATGSWDAAVASYHSADPARGGPYRDQVLATWHNLEGRDSRGRHSTFARAEVGDGLIMGMRVWVPGGAQKVTQTIRAGRLPVVNRPTLLAFADRR